MSPELKNELNELSLTLFGASSRWRKMVDKGVPRPLEDAEAQDKYGRQTEHMVRLTPEEVLHNLRQLKAHFDSMQERRREAVAKAQAEHQARQDRQLAVEAAQGSAQ